MKRVELTLVCALFCGSAAADWSLIGGSQTIYSAYADRDSVRRSGNSVQMLGLYDFLMADVAVDGQPHESTVVLREYDCRRKRVRLLAFVDYAGHMGAGRVISPPGAKGPARWEAIAQGSLDESFLAIACAGQQ